MEEKNVVVDSQSRGWVFTVNNPTQSEDDFYNYLAGLANLQYFIFGRERGDGTIENPEGTEHYQGYIEFTAPKKFSTIKNALSEKTIGVNAHIERRRGTKQEAHDYVRKIGDYVDKENTRIGQIYEWGVINLISEKGKRKDLINIIEMLEDGEPLTEIRQAFPTQYMMNEKRIREYQQNILFEKFQNVFRELEVTYIWGDPGTGKTRYVMDTYGYENVYRITNYTRGAFDFYEGQDVVLFEEFRGGFKIEEMLNYLDGYPLRLPARFADKVACYTKVFIVTNIALNEQYKNVQEEYPKTFQAFKRRINKVMEYPLRDEQMSVKDMEEAPPWLKE